MKTVTRITRWMLLVISLVLLTGCHSINPPANTPSSKITLKSFHGRYVTAMKADAGWSLKQTDKLKPTPCEWFTQYNLANGKIALQTCHGRYVTAPRSGSERADWQVWQDSAAGDCGQFVLERYDEGVALRTCAGNYLTAGDGGWPSPLQWSVVAEMNKLDNWEVFSVSR